MDVKSKEKIQAFIVADTVYINSAYASDSRYAMHEILHTKITPKARDKIIAELKKSGYYESVHEVYAKAYEGLSSIDIDEEIAIDAMAQLDAFERLDNFKEIRDELLKEKSNNISTNKDKRSSDPLFMRMYNKSFESRKIDGRI